MVDVIDDRRRGRDQVEVELALQPLLDDLQMQQPEEAAAEAEAERGRGLRLVMEAGVVERAAWPGCRAAARNRRRRPGTGRRRRPDWTGLKPGSAAAVGRCSSVIVSPTLVSATVLDAGGDEADLAGAEAVDRHALGREHADAIDLVGGAGRHQADFLAGLQRAVDDAHQDDDAEIGVVPAVDQQRLERRRGDRPRRRQARGPAPRAGRRCRCRSWPRSGWRPICAEC